MARKFMPQSSALMPYIVANRDAAVAGVFTVDGEGGSVDLTVKYVQITDYNQKVGSLEATVTTNTDDITNLKTSVSSINSSIGTINTSLGNKASKGVNSDITGLTGLTTALSISQGGTGGKTAAEARTNLSVVSKAGDTMSGPLSVEGSDSNKSLYGAGAIELYSSTPIVDFHYNRSTDDYSTRIINTEASALEVSAMSGPISFRINGGCRLGSPLYKGGMNIYAGDNNPNNIWGVSNGGGYLTFDRGANAGDYAIFNSNLHASGSVVARSDAPASPPANSFLSSAPLRSMFWGRGGYSDSRGAFVQLYHQEQVNVKARAILNLNGYGTDKNWIFNNDGSLEGPAGIIQGAGSDVRLKTDIVEASIGAGDRIDALGTVEYTEISTGKKRRGFISQQAQSVDPLYVDYGGETEDVDGEKFEILNIMDRAVLSDIVAVLQEARAEIKSLKQRVKELEEVKS